MATKYPTRSVRIDDQTWEMAKRRAEAEGVTISRVLTLLTEGYAQGKVALPQVKVIYGKTP